MNFQDFFEQIMIFESKNINEFMKVKFNRVHLYPIFRYSILFKILKTAVKVQEPHASSRDNKSWPFILLKSLVRDYINNLKNIKSINSADVVAISTFALRRKKINNKEFDVIYDYLLPEISNNYLLIERHFRFKNSKNPYTKNVYYSLPQSVASKINFISKLNHQNQKKVLRDFSLLISESIRGFFGSNYSALFLQEFQSVLKKFKYIYNYSVRTANIIKALSPKILFVHCGSYGGDSAIVTKICKNHGIKIVEVQHGIVNKFHLAYNYGFDKNSEYEKYLPDFFLSWGKYWTDQLKRLPVNKVVIGNPEFINNFKNYSEKQLNKNNPIRLILVVSQGIVTEKLVKLTEELSTKLPSNYKIIYKLHPGEVPFRDRYQSLYNYENITVVTYGNIYEYIKSSDFIVGHTSTTLFEALPFEKPIFVLDDQLSRMYIPNEIGIRFKNADELREMILNPEKSKYNNVDWKYYWETEWKNNLRSFIQNLK